MKAFAIILSLQALSISDLAMDRFYVLGVQQGMSLAEYNALIANGGYKSRPIKADTYWATINAQDIYVTFCNGMVANVISNLTSSDWVKSIKDLEKKGFSFSNPAFAYEGDGAVATGELMIGVTTPKGYRYGVLPLVKMATYNGKDMPAFQLMFTAFGTDCKPS